MLTVVICDDSNQERMLTEKYIRQFFSTTKSVKQIAFRSFSSGEELLQSKINPDIAILDIRMRGLSGIAVGRELHRNNPNVIQIMTTSYIEYLDEAMDGNIYRYITKPIDKNRLFRALQGAIKLYTQNNWKVHYNFGKNGYLIHSDDIIYIEAALHHTIIHTISGEIQSTDTMKAWELKLNTNSFVRVHRGYFVNLKYVTGYLTNEVILKYGAHEYRVWMSYRKYYAQFKSSFLLYLAGK